MMARSPGRCPGAFMSSPYRARRQAWPPQKEARITSPPALPPQRRAPQPPGRAHHPHTNPADNQHAGMESKQQPQLAQGGVIRSDPHRLPRPVPRADPLASAQVRQGVIYRRDSSSSMASSRSSRSRSCSFSAWSRWFAPSIAAIWVFFSARRALTASTSNGVIFA